MSKTYHFLIVDDSKDMLVLLQALVLKTFKSTITISTSGNEAADTIKRGFKYDLIISDYHMPNGNGKELFDYISTFNSPPLFILYTADYYIKGFSGNHFLGVVPKEKYQDLLVKMQMHFNQKSA